MTQDLHTRVKKIVDDSFFGSVGFTDAATTAAISEVVAQCARVLEKSIKRESNHKCCDACYCLGVKTGLAAIRALAKPKEEQS